MVGNESPCITPCLPVCYQITKAPKKIIPVSITQKNPSPSDPSSDHVMKGTGSIYSGFSRHLDISISARKSESH